MYQPFPASWQKVVRPCTPSPAPPLKFRTAGFPQYGFKLEFDGDLRPTSTYTPPQPRSQVPIVLADILAEPSYGGDPVQRPLARQRVMLSRRVIAYYGLIRASGPLPSAYYSSSDGDASDYSGGPEGPQFTLPVCPCAPSSVPR
ncbi:MAG: hypothetical protein AB1656_05470 [Candidatus Omnitrophota bacterium]